MCGTVYFDHLAGLLVELLLLDVAGRRVGLQVEVVAASASDQLDRPEHQISCTSPRSAASIVVACRIFLEAVRLDLRDQLLAAGEGRRIALELRLAGSGRRRRRGRRRGRGLLLRRLWRGCCGTRPADCCVHDACAVASSASTLSSAAFARTMPVRIGGHVAGVDGRALQRGGLRRTGGFERLDARHRVAESESPAPASPRLRLAAGRGRSAARACRLRDRRGWRPALRRGSGRKTQCAEQAHRVFLLQRAQRSRELRSFVIPAWWGRSLPAAVGRLAPAHARRRSFPLISEALGDRDSKRPSAEKEGGSMSIRSYSLRRASVAGAVALMLPFGGPALAANPDRPHGGSCSTVVAPQGPPPPGRPAGC